MKFIETYVWSILLYGCETWLKRDCGDWNVIAVKNCGKRPIELWLGQNYWGKNNKTKYKNNAIWISVKVQYVYYHHHGKRPVEDNINAFLRTIPTDGFCLIRTTRKC